MAGQTKQLFVEPNSVLLNPAFVVSATPYFYARLGEPATKQVSPTPLDRDQ